MLGSLLSTIGGGIGKYFGGGILSTIGRYAGRMFGNYLEHQALKHTISTHKFVNERNEFYISTASYGSPIPMVFGKMRVPGQIIWIGRMVEKRNNSVITKHFKAKHLTLEKNITELEYYANFAMAICEGEITELSRVWHNDDAINLGEYNFRLYKGDEDQLPDPLISMESGDHSPAYRGLAYIVFEELPLAHFGDIIPNFSFEVTKKSNVKQNSSVEDLVTSINMIPGSGEYVYDTIVQSKSRILPSGATMPPQNINSHNHHNIADSVHSLNQLQTTCQNIRWVAPVICWFGNSIDIRDCQIKPAVEFKVDNVTYSENWSVGGYDRNSAHEISKDDLGNPNYGGSVNDASILRYLTEIRSRNLKVMFYPMFFMDLPGKPWRGHLSGNPEHVRNFFHKKHGYNEFILHYANLVKNHIDAFVIGSELIGLTKIHDAHHNFPAVTELAALAERVKQIVGPGVLVTYAADWSEYHHTEGGWYNLDPLWASPNIDFVGIDAYFPATNSTSSLISKEELAGGWNSGEGFDYYIDGADGSKHDLDAPYAWKNVGYWWKNTHTNPNGQNTPWVPRSKPIWFTEFGFPSIDKAPNQPNVFFDPKCVDGNIPKNSNGNTDFSIQRRSIRAFIEYWSTQEYIGEMFLWTWDARPYPAWPHTDVWADRDLWEKGHWVNNKFGTSSLAAILLEISHRCGLDIDHIDVSNVDEMIEGFVLSNQITAMNAINTLRAAYFFDICANHGEVVSFEKRGSRQEVRIDTQNCVKISDNSFMEEIEIPKESTLSAINLHYINQTKEYLTSYIYINNEQISYVSTALIRFPISFTEHEAKSIGNLILKNAAIEDRVVKFVMSNEFKLRPSDPVILTHFKKQYSVRIIDVQMNTSKIIVTGIIDSKYNYLNTHASMVPLNLQTESNIDTALVVLDLPIILPGAPESSVIAYLRSTSSASLSGRLSTETSWSSLATLNPSSSIGEVIEFFNNENANLFLIDNISSILVRGYNLERYASDNWQRAMIGQELIQFKNLIKIDEQLYRISNLMRGEEGSEKFMHTHAPGENFVIISFGANIIPISRNLTKRTICFKAAGKKESIEYENRAKIPLEQYITERTRTDDTIYLKWVTRIRDFTDWSRIDDISPPEFAIFLEGTNQTYKCTTKENELTINIGGLALSDDCKITIIINE